MSCDNIRGNQQFLVLYSNTENSSWCQLCPAMPNSASRARMTLLQDKHQKHQFLTSSCWTKAEQPDIALIATWFSLVDLLLYCVGMARQAKNSGISFSVDFT